MNENRTFGRNFDDARATLSSLRESLAELDRSVKDVTSNPILKLRKVLPDFMFKAIGGDMTDYENFMAEGRQEREKLTEMISQFELLLSFENDPEFANMVKMGTYLGHAKRKQQENT